MKIAEQKRINAILFFANKSPDNKIDRLKLMKLLWIADRIHLNRFGRTVLRDCHFALPHGPILSKTMNLSKDSIENILWVDGLNIFAEDKFDNKYFSESDISVLEEVWNLYGRMHPKRLEDFSHEFPEWKRFKEQLEDEDSPDGYPMEIDDFFEDPKNVEDYQHDHERSKISKEIYDARQNIQATLLS